MFSAIYDLFLSNATKNGFESMDGHRAGDVHDGKSNPNHVVDKQHTNNWAVLVCSSRYWFNYRVCYRRLMDPYEALRF